MSKLPPEPLFVMRGNDSVHCALFHISASGEYLLIGTEDGMVHTWDLKSCKRIKTFQVGCNPCLSLHITGQYLITQDKTCTLKDLHP